jgi:DNA (cytosine-5)-methyltransferase 1
MEDGVRYFTVREMARLQGFPDDYLVTGTWRRVTPQLGNAVPVEVGKALGEHLAQVLSAAESREIEGSQANEAGGAQGAHAPLQGELELT